MWQTYYTWLPHIPIVNVANILYMVTAHPYSQCGKHYTWLPHIPIVNVANILYMVTAHPYRFEHQCTTNNNGWKYQTY